MNRKFARLQLNFVASFSDEYPTEKITIENAIILSRVLMLESFYPRTRLSSRMTIFGATRPVFYEFKKSRNRNWKARRRIAQSGASRRSASWIMQDARRARNVERDRNERKGCRIEKKKSSQRVSVKERFKARLIPDDHSSCREWRNRKRSAEAPSWLRARV